MADAIISRSEALARGLTNYFTGKPCKYGHVAKRTLSNGTCAECQLEKARIYRLANLESIRAQQRSWRSENKASIADYKKRHYEQNKAEVLAACKRYREDNREKISASRKLCRQNNPESVKSSRAKHYQANRKTLLAISARYAEANKERISEYKAEWKQANKPRLREMARRRYATDPAYKSELIIRRLLHRTLEAAMGKKDGRTVDILGYTASDFASHIERQFVRGMTWANYGKWHIDHIVPISAFVAKGETDPAVVNCLSNLRPLWAFENLSKGANQVSLL
ncbi:hypothetical protein JFT67_05545 [Pseudomonas simiae]|uniref:hypothetical protein n=1 Tax=Pseudomonas simiae TaxID=321846 RepID=UPI0018E76019|nr:hypothetical protein [Pseudomonas simiae]MBJ2228504.1 hypothetical protein [Pseudomonas simiae]